MSINWDDIADGAAGAADKHFSDRMAELTRLEADEIDKLIFESGISRDNLTRVIEAVKDASVSNEAKAAAIGSIHKGVDALIAIAGRIV